MPPVLRLPYALSCCLSLEILKLKPPQAKPCPPRLARRAPQRAGAPPTPLLPQHQASLLRGSRKCQSTEAELGPFPSVSSLQLS